MSSLFVGNLSSHVRHRELEKVFRRFGRSNLELKDGFGFVIYEEHRDATRALEALQGKSICGEQPSLSWARKRKPFQRYSGRSNFGLRDKYQRRETDRCAENGRRDENFLDVVKDGSRASDTKEAEARIAERESEWKESVPEKPGFDEEIRDLDPLDSGRWEPHMDSSPEHMMVDGLLENAEHGKDRDNEKAHDKMYGSVNRHIQRSSHGFRNSPDQHKRGRDAFPGRGQERCYNCGQSGHVKWQCRSRLKRISMHSRDGNDLRRNDSRYFGARGGFRGSSSGGRFRGGMNGSRRMLARDLDAGIRKRGLRRHDQNGDRRQYDPMDTKIYGKDRRRHHRSESPKDSSSRGRKKKRELKKQSKKLTHSSKKRQRLSSAGSSSSSSSRSGHSSSSSSPSGSRSPSATSRSQSSRSGSHSSSSRSHSRASPSQSSRSRSSSSASSLSSKSRSASSQSRKSLSRSGSQSVSSRSQKSRGVSSDPPSPKSKREHSSRGSSRQGSRSSADKAYKDVSVSHKHEATEKDPVSELAIDNSTDDRDDWRCSSEEHTMDAKRKERRQVWSREAKKQKIQRSDSEELNLQSNGGRPASNGNKSEGGPDMASQDGITTETYVKDSARLEASELPLHSQMGDKKCSLYVSLMKEGKKGAGLHNIGQELTTGSYGAARLWPWEAMLYRRIKRGPISTTNYEKRKAQNEEFGIKDSFVRSSSGWWETQAIVTQNDHL